MSTIVREIEVFSESMSVLDHSKSEDVDSKKKEVISRLKSKVSIQEATKVLEDAIKHQDTDLIKATIACSSAYFNNILTRPR